MPTRFKIFSDPVHGFVSVPKGLVVDLIQTPEVQRLRRVRQLGVGYMVFPGAEHTRFGHALGAMALMQDVLQNLVEKGTPITPQEAQAAVIAALLHDVGHCPFSHSLERELILGFEHEAMSRQLILRMNERFGGALELALQIFDKAYPRAFFHQLIASQLDMDRLDYLRRDSFYTGVAEGIVGVQRIIKSLRVHPIEGGPTSRIVVESKGSYAVENYLLSRRLMYWQVYLHKTVLAGDHLLRAIFQRVRQLLAAAPERLPPVSEDLLFFLRKPIRSEDIARDDVVDHFRMLDDTDVLYSMKQWSRSEDTILADLAERFVNRRFFRVTFLEQDPDEDQVESWRSTVGSWLVSAGIATPADRSEIVPYYFQLDQTRHAGYEPATDSIAVLMRDGSIQELSQTTDTRAITAIARSVEKPFVYYPKELELKWRSGQPVNQ